jgi:hypothetical protein
MTSFEIETNLFVALGYLTAGERSDLSPLPRYAPGLVSPEQLQRMLQSGLLDEAGTAPASRLSPLLEALRTAQSSTSLLFTMQAGQKEYQIYYPADGSPPVALKMEQARIYVNSPDTLETEIMAALQRLPGLASQSAASFSCRLSAIEAEALAVLIDLNRQASSRSSAQEGLSTPAVPALDHEAYQIYQASLKRADSSPGLWLFSTLFEMLIFGDERNFPQFEQVLRALASAGLVESNEQGYLLDDQVATYTNSFTTPQGGLILNVNYQPVDEPMRTERLAAFMAGEEILVLLLTSDKVLLVNPISAEKVAEIIRQVLHFPMILGEAAGVAAALKSTKLSNQPEQASMPTGGMLPALGLAHSSADAALIGPQSASVELLVLSGELENKRFPINDQIRLGREADNDLALPDKMASRHHAILQRQGVFYQISDLNSANGTFVNGKRIHEPTLFKDGDILIIGDTKLTISDRR